MKVFLSWSGEQSKAVARALRDWLPLIIQNLDPWMSQKDLGAGDRWSAEIQAHLAESKFGIICVTPDNQRAPWLNFEAGAISNSVTSAKVVPYVFEMEFADIAPGPLTQFQAKQASREGTLEVVQALNAAMERPLAPQVLADTFEMAWPRLEAKLGAVPRGQPAGQAVEQAPQRSADEKLDEVLVLLRNLSVINQNKQSEFIYESLKTFPDSQIDEKTMMAMNNYVASLLHEFQEVRAYNFTVDKLGVITINTIMTDEYKNNEIVKAGIKRKLESGASNLRVLFKNYRGLVREES